jgi:response regulator RpfG family c-di-GMP phosphodiesterase
MEVVLVGTAPHARVVAAQVTDLGVSSNLFVVGERAAQQLGEKTVAVVVVPSTLGALTARLCRTIREGTVAPVFVVSAVRARASLLRSLHRSGVTAVFEWPRQERTFLGVMARIVKAHARGQRRTTDRVLATEAQLRLDACLAGVGGELRAAVTRRVAILQGQVDAQWKVEAAQRAVAAVPGVQEVVIAGIAVGKPGPHK